MTKCDIPWVTVLTIVKVRLKITSLTELIVLEYLTPLILL